MQPNNDPVGELKTNGPAPSEVAAEMPDSRVNGGASPELLDLLNALQSMRVGDFSVRMSGSQVGQSRSSMRVLTEVSISPHAPCERSNFTRWRVFPSRPTT